MELFLKINIQLLTWNLIQREKMGAQCCGCWGRRREAITVNKNILQMGTPTCAIHRALAQEQSSPHYRCSPLRWSHKAPSCWCLYQFSVSVSLGSLNPCASLKGLQLHQRVYTSHGLMCLYDLGVYGLLGKMSALHVSFSCISKPLALFLFK